MRASSSSVGISIWYIGLLASMKPFLIGSSLRFASSRSADNGVIVFTKLIFFSLKFLLCVIMQRMMKTRRMKPTTVVVMAVILLMMLVMVITLVMGRRRRWRMMATAEIATMIATMTTTR